MSIIKKIAKELQEFLSLNNINSNVNLIYDNKMYSIFENKVQENTDVRGVLNNVKYKIALTTENRVLQSILSAPYVAFANESDLIKLNELKKIITNNGLKFIEGSYWWFGCM